jgi:hypothetical protein
MPQESIRKIVCARNMGEKIILVGISLIPLAILFFGVITDQSTRKCHGEKDSKNAEDTDCSEKLSTQQKALGLVQLGLILVMLLTVILIAKFSNLPRNGTNKTRETQSIHDILKETEEEKLPNPLSLESSGPLSALLVSARIGVGSGVGIDQPKSASKGKSESMELEMV